MNQDATPGIVIQLLFLGLRRRRAGSPRRRNIIGKNKKPRGLPRGFLLAYKPNNNLQDN